LRGVKDVLPRLQRTLRRDEGVDRGGYVGFTRIDQGRYKPDRGLILVVLVILCPAQCACDPDSRRGDPDRSSATSLPQVLAFDQHATLLGVSAIGLW